MDDIKIDLEITEKGCEALRKLIKERCLKDQLLGITYIKTTTHGEPHTQWEVLILDELILDLNECFSFVVSEFKFYCCHGFKKWAISELNNKILDAVDNQFIFFDKDMTKSQRHPYWEK